MDLPERQETIVLGCVRRGASCSVCPETAEHHLSELQRQARDAAIILDPRDRHGLLLLPPLPPRILCASSGHYPHPAGSPCSKALAGFHDSGPTSPGEQMACPRLLQCHAGLCCCRHAPHSNYDYRTLPFPQPE